MKQGAEMCGTKQKQEPGRPSWIPLRFLYDRNMYLLKEKCKQVVSGGHRNPYSTQAALEMQQFDHRSAASCRSSCSYHFQLAVPSAF